MMRKIPYFVLAMASFCGTAHAQVLAKVGGVPVTFQEVVAADPAAEKDVTKRNEVLVALINRQAVLNDAKREGLMESSTYNAAVDQAKESIAINLMAKNYSAAHPVSDQQVAATYNQIFSKPAPAQYRIRQILVASFGTAQSVVADLKNGQDFSNLAATISEDQSAAVGGEIGWQLATQLPAPIFEVLKTLKPGEVAGPISLPQGYVVIQLMAIRTAPKPPLAQVKGEISDDIAKQNWINYVIQLRAAQGAQLIVPISGG